VIAGSWYLLGALKESCGMMEGGRLDQDDGKKVLKGAKTGSPSNEPRTDRMTSRLFFCEVDEKRLSEVSRSGLSSTENEGNLLVSSLAMLPETDKTRKILAVDVSMCHVVPEGRGLIVSADQVPVEAILNINPYLPVAGVPAAGGLIVRMAGSEPELVSILRRGVWDLPKGKIDRDETPPAAAVREVKEEIGISDVHIVADLGITVHGYPERGKYRIKTTYWYQMHTSETRFVPQTEEDIEQVAWISWSVARTTLGFDNLRRLLERIERENQLVF
jgi:8-oxo-dGTP pyrophosphatase MutT (NUDIX family)